MTTRTYRGTPRNVARLGRLLREGEVVAAPTETVYGLAANAYDPKACRKIFRAKGRPANDPLIVHVASLAQFEAVSVPNEAARWLARCFWPGPLTLVLPKRALIPDVVTAGLDSVAVRMPRHPLFRKLLLAAGVPLAAPSANPFGYVSPTTAEHVRDGLDGRILAILDGGPTPVGIESTIVDVREPANPRILRPGPITINDIRRCLRSCERQRVSGRPFRSREHQRVAERDHMRAIGDEIHSLALAATGRAGPAGGLLAPGMMARHYSPRTPIRLHASLRGREPKAGEAFLLLRKPRRATGAVFWLDPCGTLSGAARRLFAMLRDLDQKGFRQIHVERAPEAGLGVAINDRLRRAASKTAT